MKVFKDISILLSFEILILKKAYLFNTLVTLQS